MPTFLHRYGPWAVVAGASEGLGAAFARDLAARGLHLVLLARSTDKLAALAAELTAAHGTQVRCLSMDLARPDLAAAVTEATADLEVGLLVYNAAFSTIGRFLDTPLDDLLRTTRVNCDGPLTLAWALGRPMAARGRGGIVLMTSLAAFQGSAFIATYGATKAFNLVLAEGLWDELADQGIDVLASCAGATRTPAYLATSPKKPGLVPVPEMEPKDVARETLDSLGRCPTLVTGWRNRAAALFMKLLPRRVAVRLMSRTTRAIYPR